MSGTKLDTREAILRAAEAEFAAHGLRGARAEAIARRAGVNDALPFYHFGSKAKLYAAVVERILLRLEDLVNRTVADYGTFERRLRVFVRGLTEYLAENPHWLRIVVRELLDNSPQVSAIFRDHLEPLVAKSQLELAREIKTGKLKHNEPLQIMISVVGEIVTYFLAAPLLKGLGYRDPFSKPALANRVRVATEVLLTGILVEKTPSASIKRARK